MRRVRYFSTPEPQTEQLKWICFFNDPSQWWDNRATSKWKNQPDFKHAHTGEALRIPSFPSSQWLVTNLARLQEPLPATRPSRAAYRTPVNKPLNDVSTLLAYLKETTNLGDVERGITLHREAVETGAHTNVYVASALVNMYVKCDCMEEAKAVFDSMQWKNAVSWNTVTMGYVDKGDVERALELLSRMKDEACPPNERTLVVMLKACCALAEKERGKLVNGRVVKPATLERARSLLSQFPMTDCQPDIYVSSALIDMYSKCGSMMQAQKVFDTGPSQNVVTWTALISGYAENGDGHRALSLFSEMQSRGFTPNSLTFVGALKACVTLASNEDGTKTTSLEQLMSVHKHVVETSPEPDVLVSNLLVDTYAKCGSLVDARTVFDRMSSHSLVSWNTLLLAYAELDEEDISVELFSCMKKVLAPSSRTYVAVLKACSSLAVKEAAFNRVSSLERGLQLHFEASEEGYDRDLYVANTLVDMYVKCGSLVNAGRVFENIQSRNVVSWNALLLGLAENGEGEQALELFTRMQREGCEPDAVTFVAALKACAANAGGDGLLSKAEELHRLIEAAELQTNRYVASSLMDTYANFGRMEESVKVFNGVVSPDVVMWTSLILGYVDNHRADTGLETFEKMKQEGACAPDARTYAAVLKACGALAVKEEGRWTDEKQLVKVVAYEKGKDIHLQARKSGFESNSYLTASLVDMYSKTGAMVEAREVFERLDHRSLAAWNSLLVGYVESRQAEMASAMVKLMRSEQLTFDYRTLTSAVKAVVAGEVVDFGTVKALHGEACRVGVEEEPVVGTCLMDAYGKSGSVGEAQVVFDGMSVKPDVVAWNALLGVYSQQGDGNKVVELFGEMVENKLQGDGVTFVSVLTACSRGGMVEEGRKLFEEMKVKYNVEAGVEHYVCMVDLLGRGNRLELAAEMLERMPCSRDNKVAWTTLLGACRKWKNEPVGRAAFERLVEIDGKDSASYILMSNIYKELN